VSAPTIELIPQYLAKHCCEDGTYASPDPDHADKNVLQAFSHQYHADIHSIAGANKSLGAGDRLAMDGAQTSTAISAPLMSPPCVLNATTIANIIICPGCLPICLTFIFNIPTVVLMCSDQSMGSFSTC
jgi:hypothetical protein